MNRFKVKNFLVLCLVLVCSLLFVAAAQAASLSQQTWVASGPGTTSITPDPTTDGVKFSYSLQGSAVYSGQSWQYSTTANQTETIQYDWNYNGFHAWFMTSAIAKVFVDGPGGRVYTTLFDGSGGVGGGFNVTGTSSIQVNQGYTYGFEFYGKNSDSDNRLIGNFTIKPPDKTPPTTSDNAPTGWVNHDTTVNLNANDSGSGVAATYYRVNMGAQQSGTSIPLTVEGTHTILYWSVDNKGNVEPQHTVTVKIDKTAPIISSGYVNTSPWTYCASENQFCSFTGTKEVRYGAEVNGTPYYIYKNVTNGVSCSNSVFGDPLYGTHKSCYIRAINGTIPTQVGSEAWYNGPVTISFTCVDNISGIASCTSNQTVSSEGSNQSVTGSAIDIANNQSSIVVSGINIDKTAPTTADNAPTGWVNTNVTVNLSATDSGSGVAATKYTVDGGAQQSGTSIVLTTVGVHTIVYWSVDNVGNIEPQHTATVKIDKTAPATTDNAPTSWVNADVTISLNASDSASGVAITNYTVDGSAQQTGSSIVLTEEGVHTIAYWSVDNAGNVEAQHTATVKIDKTTPTTSDDAPAAWVNTNVTVSLNASDSASGVAATNYTVDGGVQQTGSSVVLTAEGVHTIAYWSIDNAGNVEAQHSAAVKIDKTAPTTSDDAPAAWVNTDVTVNLNASDNASGVAATNYTVDGGAQQTGSSVVLTAEGVHTITYWSVDNAGNVETQLSRIVKIDKTAATTTDNAPVVWVKTDVTVSLNASDSASGVAAINYTVDGGAQQTGSSVVLTAEGVHTIAYWSVDKAGNVETQNTIIVKIDKTSPLSEASINPAIPNGSNGWYTSNVMISLSATDNLSGVMKSEYRVNSGAWTTYIGSIPSFGEGVYKVDYRSTDNAGNLEQFKTIEFKIDKTAPKLTVQLDKSVLWSPNHKMVTINATLNYSDGTSGIASVVLTSITSNEPDNGLGDGDTANDIQNADFGTKDTSFSLRAERSGKGTGRIYTITYTITDNAGKESTAVGTVSVPHNN